jgi:hypothetical protein
MRLEAQSRSVGGAGRYQQQEAQYGLGIISSSIVIENPCVKVSNKPLVQSVSSIGRDKSLKETILNGVPIGLKQALSHCSEHV